MTAVTDLGPITADLEVAPGEVRVVELPAGGEAAAARLAEQVASGAVLGLLDGAPDDAVLSSLRDALWPDGHVTAVYRIAGDGTVRREALGGGLRLEGRVAGGPSTALYVRSREQALGRDTTVAKFDANAEGWNGVPGTPTYPHFRWMRRLVADVARPAPGTRTLDAGCGAGWVGIEAARRGAMVSAFDPSPAMVEIVRRNAEATGVDLDARVGFVEDVPFGEPFDLVLNSGVISFAPDAEVYLDRLDALLRPEGRLVIGDLNPLSRGFRRRRRRPLLPARELNALPREEVESALVRRGYHVDGRWYYQLTFPVPELMALSEQRLGGFLCGLALVANKTGTALDHACGSRGTRWFDSWIVSATRPA